jgi:hypothetical protein
MNDEQVEIVHPIALCYNHLYGRGGLTIVAHHLDLLRILLTIYVRYPFDSYYRAIFDGGGITNIYITLLDIHSLHLRVVVLSRLAPLATGRLDDHYNPLRRVLNPARKKVAVCLITDDMHLVYFGVLAKDVLHLLPPVPCGYRV